MRARLALIITTLLGAAVLVPVAVIVALGVYGAAQGGGASAVSDQGSSIQLIPASGAPGTQISIHGRDWAPRSLIHLDVEVARDRIGSESVLTFGLAEVVTSRSGGFEIDVVMPAVAVRDGASQVAIAASLADGKERAAAPFGILLPTNSLEVSVVRNGQPLAGAKIEVADNFGQMLAATDSDRLGRGSFEGLPTGPATVTVVALGNRPIKNQLRMPLDGQVDLRFDLGESNPRRLKIPDPANASLFQLTPITIDRLSGLVMDRQFDPDQSSRRRRPVVIVYQVPDSEPGISAIEVVLRQLPNYFYFNSGVVLHIGSNDQSDFIFAQDNAFQRRRVLWAYDRSAGRLTEVLELDRRELTPLASPDGRHIYVLNWERQTLSVYDTVNGFAERTITGLPQWISAITLDPARGTIWMSSALTDVLIPLDLETDQVGDPVRFSADLIALTFDPSRRRIYGINYKRPELAMINLADGQVRFAPIANGAMWLWPDQEGDLLFAGVELGKSVQVLDKDSMAIVALHQFIEPDP